MIRQRVNQILEAVLRSYALKDRKSWDKYLPYAEFSYNNSYQKSPKISPFEISVRISEARFIIRGRFVTP
jgi:hypothetical protein